MTTRQRMDSDTATFDRRAMADRAMRDDRNRNDGLTRERRSKADRTMSASRSRNDEATATRRELRDGNSSMAFAMFLLILTALAVGTFFSLV